MKILTLNEWSTINEANEVIDLRTGTPVFIAALAKNKLCLIDTKIKDIYNASYLTAYVERDCKVKEPEIVIVINTVDKKIIMPTRECVVGPAKRDWSTKHTLDAIQSRNPVLLAKLKTELLKRNIIDDTYIFPADASGAKTKINDNTFFHGTTLKNWNIIKKKGLRPIDTATLGDKSMFRGNSSTFLGYTDTNVYLTKSPDVAAGYAIRQAKYLKSKPVVIEVTVPDIAKLLIDDDMFIKDVSDKVKEKLDNVCSVVEKYDAVYEHSVNIIYELDTKYPNLFLKTAFDDLTGYNKDYFLKTPWSKYAVATPSEYMSTLVTKNMFAVLSTGEFETLDTLPYISNINSQYMNYFQEVIPGFFDWLKLTIKQIYKEVVAKNYTKSLYSDIQAVAYNGVILPKFLKLYDADFTTRITNA